MFSVVIPVYNGAHVIEEAIGCVQAQTHQDWELIIVNDGSKDDTAKVLAKYADEPKIRIITQENGGVSAARNTGMRAATQPVIAFLDADDLWRENHLAVLKEMIETYPEAGMYCTFAENHLVNGEIITECHYFQHHPQTVCLEDFFAAYAEDKSVKMFSIFSSCVRAEIVERLGGFPVGCKIGEDLEFALKIAAYYPVALTARPTVIYRREYSTATKDKSFDPDWHFFGEVEKLYADPAIPEEKKQNIRRVMQWFQIRRSRHYAIDGRKREAIRAYRAIGPTELRKDKLLTAALLLLPCKLVRHIFLMRWRGQA